MIRQSNKPADKARRLVKSQLVNSWDLQEAKKKAILLCQDFKEGENREYWKDVILEIELLKKA